MNYLNLFQHQESLQCGDFTCFIFRKGGRIYIPARSTHSMVFILQGSVHLNFKHQSEDVKANELVVMERNGLRYINCQPNTIVLKYTLPQKLTTLFDRCFSALRKECSTPIIIRPELQGWIDELLTELSTGTGMDMERCCHYRRALGQAIMTYPQERLEEIYVPFYACTRANCENCHIK